MKQYKNRTLSLVLGLLNSNYMVEADWNYYADNLKLFFPRLLDINVSLSNQMKFFLEVKERERGRERERRREFDALSANIGSTSSTSSFDGVARF